MKRILFLPLFSLVIFACENVPTQEWKETSLLACCQLPISILAPDSADIKSNKMGGLFKDVTIQSGEDYFVQIYASEASTNDISRIKSEQLAQVRTLPFFTKIVEEDERGFLYENIIDSSNINYSFRYAAVQGDMEYIFQPGLTGLFTEGEARRMYEAVKQK